VPAPVRAIGGTSTINGACLAGQHAQIPARAKAGHRPDEKSSG